MGRMVWFGMPIVGGLGFPAVAVVAGIAAFGAAMFYAGRRTAPASTNTAV